MNRGGGGKLLAALHPTGIRFDTEHPHGHNIAPYENGNNSNQEREEQMKDMIQITLENLAHQASIETLFEFCTKLSEKLDIKEIDGIPVQEWFNKKNNLELMLF